MWANEQPSDVEVWGLNEGHTWMTRADRWFQVHPRNWKETAREEGFGKRLHRDSKDAYGRNTEHIEWLATCDIPVYMNVDDERIPTRVKYPLDEIARRFGKPHGEGFHPYLSSTPAYMIALAMYEHSLYRLWKPWTWSKKISEIRLAGIELAVGTEYFYQRPCFEFYLGLAKAMGIEVTLPPAPYSCSLLGSPVYGIDEELPKPKDWAGKQMNLVIGHEAVKGARAGEDQNASVSVSVENEDELKVRI